MVKAQGRSEVNRYDLIRCTTGWIVESDPQRYGWGERAAFSTLVEALDWLAEREGVASSRIWDEVNEVVQRGEHVPFGPEGV